MTLKHFFKTFLFFSFLSFSVFAQKNFVLSGQIVDLAGKTIPNGTVKLLDTNSEIVKAVQVKEGVFSIDSVHEGRYILNTSSIGFNDDIKNIILNRDTSLILIMVDNSTLLNEVQISGTKQNFSNSKGNIKVNIENTILSQVPSAIELLSKLPAVQLSPDGETLSIVGRGDPLIYLDNQRITLNDLNSLATNDIKTIEIVHNPSSKYEAEGRSVIVITRNKSTADGSKVTLSTTNSFKRYFHSRNGLNVNIKKDRLEFKGNMQYNYLNLWESISNDFNITDEDIATKYRVYSIDTRIQTIINGGLYYQLNETDYLSANVSKRFQDGVFINTTDTYIKQPESDDFINTINNNKEGRPLFNSNVNFNKKFKEQNGQIFLGVQYAQFSHDLASNIYNNYNETGTVLSQDRKQNYGVDVVSARADFDKSLKNKMKVEIGASFSSAASNSILKQTDYMPTLHLASDFDYEEQISSAYTQVSGKIKRANFSAGLRMENTNVNGTGGGGGIDDKEKLYGFFPKSNF